LILVLLVTCVQPFGFLQFWNFLSILSHTTVHRLRDLKSVVTTRHHFAVLRLSNLHPAKQFWRRSCSRKETQAWASSKFISGKATAVCSEENKLSSHKRLLLKLWFPACVLILIIDSIIKNSDTKVQVFLVLNW